MKQYLGITLLAVFLLQMGCASTCKRGELHFEPPEFSSGAQWPAPATIYSVGGLYATLVELYDRSGAAYFGSSHLTNTPTFPIGIDQVIRMSTTAINIDLRLGTTRAEFEYLDEGAIINLAAHGSPPYVGKMSAMPATLVLGGVTVTRSNVQIIKNSSGVQLAETGVIVLKSAQDIGAMLIGGQELFLDNFCFN